MKQAPFNAKTSAGVAQRIRLHEQLDRGEGMGMSEMGHHLVMTNIAMENGPLIDGLPIKKR